jgi:hypothetical protein
MSYSKFVFNSSMKRLQFWRTRRRYDGQAGSSADHDLLGAGSGVTTEGIGQKEAGRRHVTEPDQVQPLANGPFVQGQNLINVLVVVSDDHHGFTIG